MRPIWIRNALKIAGINAAITICLLGLVLMVPALWSDLRSGSRKEADLAEPTEHTLPLYQNAAWAKQHFIEIGRLGTQYYDFIGWRRTQFSGETITIDENGFRRHTSEANEPS